MERPPSPPEGQIPEGAEPFPSFDAADSPAGQPLPLQRGGSGGGDAAGPANPWIVGLAIAAVLVAVSIIAFGLFASDGTTTAETTSTSAGDSTPTSTTVPGDETSTTVPGDDGSTTTTQATGTTVTLPSGDSGEIIPSGDPIPIGELTMSSNDIGPLDFNEDGAIVLSRLAATFGDPTQDTGFFVGNGAWGECPGDSIRVVQWGPLNVVTRGEPEANVFVSYRMDLRFGGITSQATDMSTLSGLRVGDTVAQLESTYAGFVIDYVVDADLGLVFELRSERDGPLLLWGPVDSQDDNGLITGIYSPDSCS